jgi:hypothetical protein
MNQPVQTIASDPVKLPALPLWVTKDFEQTPQNVAFLSGAALGVLDAIIRQDEDLVPKDLLVRTLAFKAAIATSKLEGRMSTEADIRDAYYLTPPGDDGIHHWGPDGDGLAYWRRAVRRPLTSNDWITDIEDRVCLEGNHLLDEWVSEAMAHARTGGLLAASVSLMRRVLAAHSRDERLACILSDVVLSKSMSWDVMLPLTAQHLTKAKLRNLVDQAEGADLEIQRAILKSIQSAVRLAKDAAAKANALREITPKLRSRGADDAVALFLSENIVSPPSMLAPVIKGSRTEMSPRNARRLCDRLVELGVVRELTGRSTFRLYGVGV